MQTIKAKQSLYYTHAQVSSASKVCFFPNRKPGVATIHRLPKPAFLVDSSGVLQPKNSVLGLMGIHVSRGLESDVEGKEEGDSSHETECSSGFQTQQT